MEKIDFKKKLKAFYSASAEEPVIVDVPVINYLMIDGLGDPNKAQEYQEAMEALWWADDMSAAFYIMRFESFTDGLSAQIMHIGPYDNEGPAIEKLHNFIHEKECKLKCYLFPQCCSKKIQRCR